MSYTVGIKRRYWFGYRKLRVTGHDWQNGRFLLNLEDGSQEHLPGFHLDGLRVYPDFWVHLKQLEHSRPAAPVVAAPTIREPAPVRELPLEAQSEPPAVTRRQGIQLPDEFDETLRGHLPPPETPDMTEARRRATERVRDILANGGTH